MKFPIEIPGELPFDVLGFGTNAVDFLISVPHFPEFASKVELTEYSRNAGGEIASTMVGLQRLGVKTLYAGSFGGDDAGKFGLQTLVDEGVDTTLCRIVEGAETQIAFIVIDEQSGERTVIWKRDAQLAHPPDEALLDAATRCRILHMTHHDSTTGIELAKRAKANGAIVSIDVDNSFPRMDELLPLVDLLITSSNFPSNVLNIDDPRQALEAMHSKYQNALVGITLGRNGSIMMCDGEFFESPGFAVPGGCKDTTGAGDAFRVGLLYGILTGEPIKTTGKMANAVAALKCRAVGARTALPSPGELRALLNKQ